MNPEEFHPLVSVIMPAFNARKHIREAIESVLEQDYENWELLIVNDGSTDDTAEIISEFSDERIKYFEQENQGVSAARNLALKCMNGEFIALLDSDDVYPKNSISSRLKVFAQSPNADLVDGKVEVKDKTLSQTLRTFVPEFRGNPLTGFCNIDEKCYFGPSCMLRVLPNKNHEFKVGMTHCEDLLFYMNVAKEGGLYDYTEELVLIYRKSAEQAMANLKGLERGYRTIFKESQSLVNFSFKQRWHSKIRMMKIMCLSYLKRGEFYRALRVLWRYFFM